MDLSEIKNKKKFATGRTAYLYLLEDGNILKLFKNSRDLYEMERFKYMLNYDNDSFVFPFEFIYDDKKFYGYITRKALGQTIESVFFKSNLLDLSTHSLKLEKDIDYVSKGGIALYDFHDQNLLYDGKKFSAIDHDENGIYKTEEYAKDINYERHRIMIGKLFENNIEKHKNTNFILDKVSEYKYMNIRPSEMIYRVKDDMEKYINDQIETVDDFNGIIRK